MTDVIVVGSGPGGVNAAAALVEAGRTVVMLDVGTVDGVYAPLIPRRPFAEVRRHDPEQHRYFLGDRFEGIAFGPVRVGAQLTPPRMHIMANVASLMPIDSDGFSAAPSLARGGLGAGWSAGVFPFDDSELAAMGLSLRDLAPHYERAAERIGICGAPDDLDAFFPWLDHTLPPLDLDTNATTLVARYDRRRARLNARGFFLGRTRLAVSTREHRGRGPEGYFDMAYWADHDRSIYRPQWTLAELERDPRFTYIGGRFVERFDERGDTVTVTAVDTATGTRESHAARALVCAAGALGTGWLVLRSLERYDTTVPVLCNPYAYSPTLNLGMLGRQPVDRRSSLAQLTAMLRVSETPARTVQAQLFSYRSLLTFKLMKELPLPFAASRRMLQLLMPNFAILGVHHEDRPSPGKTLAVQRDPRGGPDRLTIRYHPTNAESRQYAADTRRMVACVRALGCVPLGTVRPGHGANLHYAGTFPIQATGGDLTCESDGRLRATRHVFIADGSVFPWLPPKGLTFNIMANADRVGSRLAARLG